MNIEIIGAKPWVTDHAEEARLAYGSACCEAVKGSYPGFTVHYSEAFMHQQIVKRIRVIVTGPEDLEVRLRMVLAIQEIAQKVYSDLP